MAYVIANKSVGLWGADGKIFDVYAKPEAQFVPDEFVNDEYKALVKSGDLVEVGQAPAKPKEAPATK